MKIGLEQLTAFEVGALRIVSAGIVLLPFALKAFQKISKQKWVIIGISGLLGSFFPAFLFCIAETKISSALTSMLNALTPLCTVIIGSIFFKTHATKQQFVGIILGLIGLYFLVAPDGSLSMNELRYTSLVMLATIFYALNVHLVRKQMIGFMPIDIAAIAFTFLLIPSILILAYNGYFNNNFTEVTFLKSTVAASVLGIAGTAVASVLFYKLVKIAGALFASMVTYGIPFIAVIWGVIYDETITILQLFCLGIILIGVSIVNKKK